MKNKASQVFGMGAMGVVLVAMLLVWWSRDDASSALEVVPEAVAQVPVLPSRSPRNETPADTPTDTPAATAFEALRPRAILILDDLTDLPLAETTVTLVDTATVVPVVVSDAQGNARFDAVRDDAVAAAEFRLSDELGGQVFRRDIKGAPAGSVPNVVRLPAYALIDVRVDGLDASTRDETMTVRVASLPTKEDLSKLSDRDRERFQFNRIDPETHRRSYAALGHADRLIEHETSLSGGVEDVSLPVAHDGPVYVTVWSSKIAPTGVIVEATPGERIEAVVRVRKKVVVGGTLTDAGGRPLPNTEVMVSARSFFREGETIPRSETEAGNPAFTMRGRRGSSGAEVIALQRGRTDDNGRFRVAMPYSDEVAAWSFVGKTGRAFASRDVGGRDVSVEDLVLEFVSSTDVVGRVRFLRPDGTPAARLGMKVSEISPSSRFAVQYPRLETDEDGFLSLGLLDLGRNYVVFPDTTVYGNAEFRSTPGMTVTLKRATH